MSPIITESFVLLHRYFCCLLKASNGIWLYLGFMMFFSGLAPTDAAHATTLTSEELTKRDVFAGSNSKRHCVLAFF